MKQTAQVICAACGIILLASAGCQAWVLIRIFDVGIRVQWWSAEGYPPHEFAKNTGIDIMHLSTLGLVLLGVLALGTVTVLTLTTGRDTHKKEQPQHHAAGDG